MDKVLQLQGVTFRWNQKDYPNLGFIDGTQMGLIAQQVEPIIPEVVRTNQDGYKSVEYGNLTGLLIEAVKELKTEDETLKARITVLEAKQ